MLRLLILAMVFLPVAPAFADDGRILGTGGATQIEGAGGGGLVPWATIVGYAAPGQSDFDFSYSAVRTGDFDLDVAAIGVGFNDRLELSLARQRLLLSGPQRQSVDQDIAGLKLRLAGDLIYGKGPQFSLGLQYKRQRDQALTKQLGAADGTGLDIYLAASKLLLDGPGHRNLLLSATVRATTAHQTGLLGFDDDFHFVPEFSVASFINPRFAVGAEYRFKPDALTGIAEDDWWDLYLAWFPNKRFTAVIGYANLGSVAGLENQDGLYLNLKWNP